MALFNLKCVTLDAFKANRNQNRNVQLNWGFHQNRMECLQRGKQQDFKGNRSLSL